MTWRGYLLVLALISSFAIGWWTYDRLTMPPIPFSSKVLSIVQEPEKVRVQRMMPMEIATQPEGAAYYESCALIGAGKAIDPPVQLLNDLVEILTDGRTYEGSVGTGTPVPKVVIRFVRGDTRIDAMLAFNLNTVVVQQDGKPVGTGVFNPRRKDLVRLVKELFPEDLEILAIPEQSETL